MTDQLKEERDTLCLIDGVYKRFGSQSVLNGVGLKISEGESVTLMGPSGSGKSTLLNCLSGIDSPDQGTVEIAGLKITSASPVELAELRRGTVSTVFQFFHLLPTLTAYENIELSLQLNKKNQTFLCQPFELFRKN